MTASLGSAGRRTMTITLTIDIPDNVAVTVGSGGSSGLSPAVPSTAPQSAVEPPWPIEAPDMTPAALEAFPDALVQNPDAVLHDTHVEAAPTPPPDGHHNLPWKYVPAGVSARTGKPYAGFWACAERDCNVKPPRPR